MPGSRTTLRIIEDVDARGSTQETTPESSPEGNTRIHWEIPSTFAPISIHDVMGDNSAGKYFFFLQSDVQSESVILEGQRGRPSTTLLKQWQCGRHPQCSHDSLKSHEILLVMRFKTWGVGLDQQPQ